MRINYAMMCAIGWIILGLISAFMTSFGSTTYWHCLIIANIWLAIDYIDWKPNE